MKINHLSISRLQVWRLCQKQYEYKYHLELPIPGKEPIYFLYGSIIHKIAEKYIENSGKIPLNELAESVLKGKIELNDRGKPVKATKINLPAEYKKKLPEHLRYLQKITNQLGFGGKTEWPFEYDLDPPNKRCVVGYIDRLIQKDDKFWIIDYKTSKQGWHRKNAKNITDDLQLRCYARIVQKTFDVKAENIKTALYYLEGGELIGACFSEDSLERIEKDLLKAYLDIESTQPSNVWGNVGDHCRMCPYLALCPFRALT